MGSSTSFFSLSEWILKLRLPRVAMLVATLILLSGCFGDEQAEKLSERWAKHDWSQNQPELMLDINNDGQFERALIGFGERTIVVAVFVQEKVHLIDFVEIFTNKPGQRNALCSADATLSVIAQKSSPLSRIAEFPVGLRVCEQCQKLLLIDKVACDNFNIYWNHESQRLNWWRD